jgi:DNA mismatch repair protein MutS
MADLTPAMRQYLMIKSENADTLLFFRMGDFYELFFDDAVAASRILGIALTTRDKAREIPMCGVPYHSAAPYVARLVREGYRVAICEQVEDPSEAKGVIERAVTRVVTPGTALEDELLDPKVNNFIAAAISSGRSIGFAYMDVSTGEFRATVIPDQEALDDEVMRLKPREVLVEDGAATLDRGAVQGGNLTPVDPGYFEPGRAGERLRAHFGVASLDGFGLTELPEAVRAAGALIRYAAETRKTGLTHIKACTPYYSGEYLVLDHAAERNLEIFEGPATGGREATLINVLDRTRTPMGARRLRSWLLYPLRDAKAIAMRQDGVGWLVEERGARAGVQEGLKGVHDLERLMVKVTLGAANPRDIVCLGSSLAEVPGVKDVLNRPKAALRAMQGADGPSSVEASTGLEGAPPAFISAIAARLDCVEEAVRLIGSALVDSPPPHLRDGGVIREGYSAELDRLREIGSGGRGMIAAMEAQERAATGISSLKVGYNRVFGYYIEIPNAKAARVPPGYVRRQTLANAERYVTDALKDLEGRILGADERALGLEASLFADLRSKASGYADRVRGTADAVSDLDAIASFAEVSTERGYTRPAVDDGDVIDIEGGRHPVIEAIEADFVANDVYLDNASDRLVILTGPNMAGKSTYLRQCALIVLMAHTGCFVPAARARIGVVDRIFTRVGASDDIARGRSTFMVEMNEAAKILNCATPKSLIILDEIGRGTSTFDGLSIAWAMAEHIHDHPGLGAKTLFATHYHELADLSLERDGVKNLNLAVKEWNGRLIFLRKVVPGGALRSYGIEVARLAGMPESVIARAWELLGNIERGELNEAGQPRIAAGRKGVRHGAQLSLLGERDPMEGVRTKGVRLKRDELRDELETLDPERMTPIEAIAALARLKGMTEGGG